MGSDVNVASGTDAVSAFGPIEVTWNDTRYVRESTLFAALEHVHELGQASSALLATWNNWGNDLPPDHPVAKGIVRLRAVVERRGKTAALADGGAMSARERMPEPVEDALPTGERNERKLSHDQEFSVGGAGNHSSEFTRLPGSLDERDTQQAESGGTVPVPSGAEALPSLDWEDCTGNYYCGVSLCQGDGYWPSMLNFDHNIEGNLTGDDVLELAGMLLRAADVCDASNDALFGERNRTPEPGTGDSEEIPPPSGCSSVIRAALERLIAQDSLEAPYADAANAELDALEAALVAVSARAQQADQYAALAASRWEMQEAAEARTVELADALTEVDHARELLGSALAGWLDAPSEFHDAYAILAAAKAKTPYPGAVATPESVSGGPRGQTETGAGG